MLHRRNAIGAVAISTFALMLAACGDSETTTIPAPSTTTVPVTSTEAPTTTVAEASPQPLPSSGFLEPGVEYVTTIFEPVVGYRVDEKLLLRPFQTDLMTGLENRKQNIYDANTPYKGVVIHNIWFGLTPDEAMARIEQIDAIEIGASSQVEIGGFSGTQIDVVVVRRGLLYEPDRTLTCGLQSGLCPWLEAGPMRIVVLDTSAGTLIATIESTGGADFEEFLPVAEEILAGISFPDLG